MFGLASASQGCGRVNFGALDAGQDAPSVEGLDAPPPMDAPTSMDVSVREDAPSEFDARPSLDASIEDAAPVMDAPLPEAAAPDAVSDPDASMSPDSARQDAGFDGGRPPGAGPNVVFISTTQRAGDFGGVEVADAICIAEAASAGLPGNFVAWLASPTTSAVVRLGSASGWVRPDGLVVAISQSSLISSRLLHTITLHADGSQAAISDDPYVGGADDCASWTSASMAVMGRAGRLGSVHPSFESWGAAYTNRCSATRPFLCFQVDHAEGVVSPTPVAGRRMFVSSRAAGRTPDVTCQESADAAGLVGAFRAFVPFTGVSAVSRFALDGRAWVTLDGLVIFRDDAAVLAGAAAAPVMYTASLGSPVAAPVTAIQDPNAPGTSANTCADWTALGPAVSRTGSFGRGGRPWFGYGADTCDGHPDPTFYCAED